MAVNPHVRGGTDVPVTDGGTGSSVAATALSNLGGLASADHTTLNHAGLPGVGDLTTAAHGSLDHAGIPGVGFSQVSQFTFTWTNNGAAQSTGSLGFTPAYCIALGMFGHDASGTAAASFAATNNSSITFGIATGTGSLAKSVSQHCEDGGTSDEDATSHDSSSIAGVTAVNTGSSLSHSVASLDVTAFGASNITLDPSVNITARVTLLVIGS